LSLGDEETQPFPSPMMMVKGFLAIVFEDGDGMEINQKRI
jgi:hypothetical protein